MVAIVLEEGPNDLIRKVLHPNQDWNLSPCEQHAYIATISSANIVAFHSCHYTDMVLCCIYEGEQKRQIHKHIATAEQVTTNKPTKIVHCWSLKRSWAGI